MPKATDHTGKQYGACRVIGRTPGEKLRWITECTHCGRVTERSSDALRVLRNLGGYERCNSCVEKTFAHLKPINEQRRDDGIEWRDGDGFVSTKLGRMQQDFYLGKMR